MARQGKNISRNKRQVKNISLPSLREQSVAGVA
jgi:hypothetical protein